MNKKVFDFLKFFFPFAVLITGLGALILITVQQSYRQSANDPQIQIAEDIANIVAQGQDPRYFIPQGKIDISKSLATYIILFDKNGNLIGSSAILDNKSPELPNGVLNSAKEKGETRITWQPKASVRSATVIKYYSGKNSGFILVGRSLREVEAREDNLTKVVLLAWVLILIASAYSFYFLDKKK